MSENESTELTTNVEQLNKQKLDAESVAIINAIVNETDVNKAKDLTYLFNINQNKKTMARVNKLNDLLDTITVQTIERFSKHPDEITNQELLQALKIVQDTLERGQKQAVGVPETPLIQINQQTNEINMPNSGQTTMSKESRDKVKNAVMSILSGLTAEQETVMPADTVVEVVDTEDLK